MLISPYTSRRSVSAQSRRPSTPKTKQSPRKNLIATSFNPIDSILSSPKETSPRKSSPIKRSTNVCSEMKLFLSPMAVSKLETCSQEPNSCPMSNLLRSLRFNFGPKIKVKLEQTLEEVLTHNEVEILFNARCKDIGINPNDNQITHFIQYCKVNCINHKIIFNEMGVGPHFSRALKYILSSNSNCTNIEMSKNSLGDEGAAQIAQIIKASKTLVHVDISSNEIKQAGGEAIFSALQSNETVLCLKIGSKQGLHRNRLGPMAMLPMETSLRHNSILTFLDLQYNGIGNNGIQPLSEGLKWNKTVSKLNICGNEITHEGAMPLIAIIFSSKLLYLDLSENQLTNETLKLMSDELREHKDMYSTIRDITMNSVGFTPDFGENLRHILSKFGDLQALRIDKNNCSNYDDLYELCHIFQSSKKFHTLSLNSCQLKEISVVLLCATFNGNSVLKELNLSSNKISSTEILKKIIECIQCSNISKLDLSNNHISNENGLEIAIHLPTTKLESVNLSQNYIKASTLQTAKQCIAQSSILHLNMKKNMVYKEVIREVDTTIRQNINRKRIKTSQGHRLMLAQKSMPKEYLTIEKEIHAKSSIINEVGQYITHQEEIFKSMKEREYTTTGIVENKYVDVSNKSKQLDKEKTEVITEIEELNTTKVNTSTVLHNTSKELESSISTISEKIESLKRKKAKRIGECEQEISFLKNELDSASKELYFISLGKLQNLHLRDYRLMHQSMLRSRRNQKKLSNHSTHRLIPRIFEYCYVLYNIIFITCSLYMPSIQ